MSCSCNACCDQCCPEPASEITIDNSVTNVTIEGAALTVTVPAHSPTDTVEVEVQADVAANIEFRWWLEDSGTPSGKNSVIPPTTPGVSQGEKVTDDTGLCTLEFKHTGSLRTWYLYCSVAGAIAAGGAITLGT